jgi:adenylate cyclase
VGYQYTSEFRRRRQLRRAFSAYLSPYMADRIADSEFDLRLGGTEVEATVMFTDLEGFTKMSESLPPAQVSKILTTYFNQTTRAILEQDGTIIKYIGDAVMAVWGAPVADAKHAERAVLAAWGMSEAGKKEVEGRRLRTRLGVNSGLVLAGNLGSDFRFDYTLIGDAVNFAARLEGLNKYLGTDILISEATRQQLSARIKVRLLGRFIVVGKKKPAGIYEVLGLAESFEKDAAWLTTFDNALNSFVKRDLDSAERLMRQVMALRGGQDGPAEFYLREICKAREKSNAPELWDGAVTIETK